MKGVGASSRLWQLLDRKSLIPRSGLFLFTFMFFFFQTVTLPGNWPGHLVSFFFFQWNILTKGHIQNIYTVCLLVGVALPDGDLDKGIEFKNVHFKYPTRPDVPIFSSLNLKFPARHVTAVVGPSGSGKSTITSLLLRFYDPDVGSILIGSHDSRDVQPDWIRSHIGIVSQV